MSKILVATDLSERSAHAVQRAVQLVRRLGSGEWSLVHVVDNDAPADHVERQIQQAETLLQAQAETLAEQAGSRPRVVVSSGEVAPVITETAQGLGADLLIVGAHRKSALRDFFVGTTLERVVRSSHLPVLRVNGPVVREYQHALLALDLSATSMDALRQASRFGLLDVNDFDAVHAIEPPPSSVVLEANLGSRLLDSQLEGTREQVLGELKEAGVNLPEKRLRIQPGLPELVIEESLRQSGADLLVLGTHARQGFSRLVLGSVAVRLLERLDCDALIVPPRH